MKRFFTASLAVLALLALSAASAPAYTDNMLPNAMPAGWEQAPYQIICDVEVEGKKVHTHFYRSFATERTFPVWKILMDGREGKHLWISIESAASQMAPIEKRVYKHMESGGWSETAPDLTNFSQAELKALLECVEKKAKESKNTK